VKALSLALAGNKVLGKFIKKLRVEGGYGEFSLRERRKLSGIYLVLYFLSSLAFIDT
jgi:hypothetical protein